MFTTWLIVFTLLVLIEIVTENLVSIWFAIGALGAAISTFFINDALIQFAIFTIVSIIALASTRRFVKNFNNKETIKTNADRVIGKIGIITEEIRKDEPGEVKVDGKKWTAIASKKIKLDSKVEILSIEGVKLKVKEIKEELET